MFFVVSKILGFFAVPSNLIAMLCVIALVLLLTRRRSLAKKILAGGVLLLVIFGWSPAGNVLLLSLSERFPRWEANGRKPDGIIVLGGAIKPDLSAARDTLEVDGAAERIIAMLELARTYPDARIVFSGGSGYLVGEHVPEAPLAQRLLERFGIDPKRITLDPDSRTTQENAVFVHKLISPKSGEIWLLVTSAFHMPRAIGAFRAAGVQVEAYPVDWRTRGWIDASTPFAHVAEGLARTDTATHEWIGLLTYWLTGRSKTLFPAP